jgi:hypothetical protein
MVSQQQLEAWRQESLRVPFDAAQVPTLPKLINLKTFCERTSTCDTVARQWIREGKLKALSPNGKTLRIPVTEIDRLFQPVPTGADRPVHPRPGTPKSED